MSALDAAILGELDTLSSGLKVNRDVLTGAGTYTAKSTLMLVTVQAPGSGGNSVSGGKSGETIIRRPVFCQKGDTFQYDAGVGSAGVKGPACTTGMKILGTYNGYLYLYELISGFLVFRRCDLTTQDIEYIGKIATYNSGSTAASFDRVGSKFVVCCYYSSMIELYSLDLTTQAISSVGAPLYVSGDGFTSQTRWGFYITDTCAYFVSHASYLRQAIRKADFVAQTVTTIAGVSSANATMTLSDDGTGTAAKLATITPSRAIGNEIFFGDNNGTIYRLRKLSLTTGQVTTLSNTAGTSGLVVGTGAAASVGYMSNFVSDPTGGRLFWRDAISGIVCWTVSTGVLSMVSGTTSAGTNEFKITTSYLLTYIASNSVCYILKFSDMTLSTDVGSNITCGNYSDDTIYRNATAANDPIEKLTPNGASWTTTTLVPRRIGTDKTIDGGSGSTSAPAAYFGDTVAMGGAIVGAVGLTSAPTLGSPVISDYNLHAFGAYRSGYVASLQGGTLDTTNPVGFSTSDTGGLSYISRGYPGGGAPSLFASGPVQGSPGTKGAGGGRGLVDANGRAMAGGKGGDGMILVEWI